MYLFVSPYLATEILPLFWDAVGDVIWNVLGFCQVPWGTLLVSFLEATPNQSHNGIKRKRTHGCVLLVYILFCLSDYLVQSNQT
jgi:hypothetical protein